MQKLGTPLHDPVAGECRRGPFRGRSCAQRPISAKRQPATTRAGAIVRIVRTIGAALAWLLASVLLVLAVVLSVTVILLPVGLLLGFASIQLYRVGLKWALLRASDVRSGVSKQARRWRRDPTVRKLRRAASEAFSAGPRRRPNRRAATARKLGRVRRRRRNLLRAVGGTR